MRDNLWPTARCGIEIYIHTFICFFAHARSRRKDALRCGGRAGGQGFACRAIKFFAHYEYPLLCTIALRVHLHRPTSPLCHRVPQTNPLLHSECAARAAAAAAMNVHHAHTRRVITIILLGVCVCLKCGPNKNNKQLAYLCLTPEQQCIYRFDRTLDATHRKLARALARASI